MSPKSRSAKRPWKYWMNLIDCNGNKVKDWCIEGKNDFTVYCVFCNVVFTISSGGKSVFLSHAKSCRHRTAADEIKKSYSRTEFENILENGASLNVNSSSSSEMKPCTPLSEYEKMLAEKRAKNQEYLQSLGIDEMKNDAAKFINSKKRRKARTYKKRSDPIILRIRERVDYSGKVSSSAKKNIEINNKENTHQNSWHLGNKYNSESAGTRRKRESRSKKRKIFNEDGDEMEILQNQEDIKNCLLSIKAIEKKKMQQQEELLNMQKAIIERLDKLIVQQSSTNVLLQALSGIDVTPE